jgi:hypothetical protein
VGDEYVVGGIHLQTLLPPPDGGLYIQSSLPPPELPTTSTTAFDRLQSFLPPPQPSTASRRFDLLQTLRLPPDLQTSILACLPVL